MKLKLKTAPAVEPVTVDEAKLDLHIDAGDENVLIGNLIAAARQLAERETKRAFITQTWLMFLDRGGSTIEIPMPPLQSIISIKAITVTESEVDTTSALGQAVLSVASTSGFIAGDLIVIDREGAREEERIILSVQEDVSLTLTAVLTYEHTAVQADRVEKYELAEAGRYYVDRSQNSYGRVRLKSGRTWPTHRGFASLIIEFNVGYGDAASDVPDALRQGILKLVAHLYTERETVNMPPGMRALFWNFKILRI